MTDEQFEKKLAALVEPPPTTAGAVGCSTRSGTSTRQRPAVTALAEALEIS